MAKEHFHGDAGSDAAFVEPEFQSAVLVCGECEGRKDGPSDLRAKDVRKSLKHGLRELRPRPRVVQTGCLGTCPKKALMAVAFCRGTAPLGAELRTDDAADALAARMARNASKGS